MIMFGYIVAGIGLGLLLMVLVLPNPLARSLQKEYLGKFQSWDANSVKSKTVVERIERNIDVLIVGCGPAGMAMALFLAKQGIKSILVEKDKFLKKWPAAHQLNFRSNELLQKDAGVRAERLWRHATPESEYRWVTVRKKLLEPTGVYGKLDHVGYLREEKERNVSWSDYMNIPQDGTETALYETLMEEENKKMVDIRFEQRWACFEQQENGDIVSTIVPHSGLSRTSYQIVSKYLIDASGIGEIRRLASNDKNIMEGERGLADVVNILVHCDLTEHMPEAQYQFQDGGAVIQFVLDPECGPVSVIHHKINKRMNVNVRMCSPLESVDDFTMERCYELVSRMLGQHREIPFRIESISPWRMDCQVAKRYNFANNRIFLVGDAGHRFPPTGGLGMNSGIGDAHNLAWKLGMTLRGEASERLLDSYSIERRQAALDNSAVSCDNFNRMMKLFEILGADSELPVMLSKIFFRLWFVPKPWLLDLFHFIQRKGLATILYRLENNLDLQKKFAESFQNQRGHFNSYGLDLGYFYDAPGCCIVHENSTAEQPPHESWYLGKGLAPGMQEHQMPEWTFHYVQTTYPGSRLPHITMDSDDHDVDENSTSSPWFKSLHRYLNYRQYTIFATTDRWKRLVEEVRKEFRCEIVCVVLKNTPKAMKLVPVNDGCLLVRPDGHIAWKCTSFPKTGKSKLKEIMTSLQNI